MTANQYQISSADIIQRVPRSNENPYACAVVKDVPINTPAIVAFGGEYTQSLRAANSYANLLQRLAEENNISQGVNFYSVVYKFGTRSPNLERVEQFRIAGRKLREKIHPLLQQEHDAIIREMNKHEPVANYVIQLYNILLKPRIVITNNTTPDPEQTINNMHKIMFYAHCHGAATIWQMAEYMRVQMIQKGFTSRDVMRIQKELLVIQHSPIAPLDKQRFTTLSFASAEDTMMQYHQNLFIQWMGENSADISPAYFKNGNLFVAGHLKEMSFQEHDHSGLLHTDENSWPLTPDGRIIFSAERNALVRGMRNMIGGTGRLPSIQKLVDGDGFDFSEMRKSGDFLYNVMLNDLRQQNPKHDHQK